MPDAADDRPENPRGPSAPPAGILAHLSAFGRALRDEGLPVGLSQVLDAARALEVVDVADQVDVYVSLRATLVSGREEFATFDRVFERFWSGRHLGDRPGPPADGRDVPATVSPDPADAWDGLGGSTAPDVDPAQQAEPDGERYCLAAAASDAELIDKDFGALTADESVAMARAIRRIAPLVATRLSRRTRRARRARSLDLRRTMRRSLRTGGDPVDLAYRRRRRTRTRVVLVCDVSGSMDRYSRFLIQFVHGLQRELSGVETFVFSTFLSRITPQLRARDIGEALERLSVSLLGWSGGTDIGGSLRTLNEQFAPRFVTSRTLVVIISDGWERGDATLLAQEMRALRRRCHRILWLNPLCSETRPMRTFCKGLAAALPHVDRLAPVNDLRSLVRLGRTLARLGV